MRITAQLIEVSDGSHLWSQSYDRDVHDIFKVQESIAVEVAKALRATLATSTSSPQRSVNIGSYNAVLRGRFLIRKQTKLDTARGIAVIQGALKLDPGYAPAWAELALGYINYLNNGWIPPKEVHRGSQSS